MKKVLIAFVLVLVAVAVWQLWPEKNVTPVEEEFVTPAMSETDNAIYMLDQPVSKEMTAAVVQVKENAFVIVLDAAENGGFGEPIGASVLLAPGKHNDVPLILNDTPENAEKLYAMLYADTDGNGAFDEEVDLPLRDAADNRVYGLFFPSSNRQ